ncbi:MAG TPA: glycosyltransferase family 4 protein [Usitatibacter sp.]|nr:glycosyltransferase family 4 protein [Usitatibacter sp.]
MNRPVVLLLAPHRSGVSGVCTHLNLLLGSSLGDDFELVHFQVGSEGRREGFLGRWLRLALSPFALFATILFRHVSVVHVNTSLNARAYWRDLVYVLIAKLLRARVLYQVHGGRMPHQFFAGSRRWMEFLRATLRLPDLIVVLSKVDLDAYRIFVPDQRLVALPNAIDCRPYAQVPTVRSRSEYPLRLVYLGHVAREKGLYEALQGLRLTNELGVDARLVVAGDGAEQDRLRRYAQALGLGPKVSFTGPLMGAARVRLLSTADALLMPSYSEGLPYALLEAMAAGVPVIATPVGAIPDVMTHGIHGLIVPPRDGKAIAEAIVKLAGDRDQLSWMSRACRKRVRAAFSMDRLASELALHYAQLADDFAIPGMGHAPRPSPRAPMSPRMPAAAGAGPKE